MNRKAIFGTVAVVAIAVAIAAVVAAGGGEDDGGLLVYGSVSVNGSALPPLPDGPTDPAVGMVAPDLAGTNFTGDPVSISNDGTPKVVLFLAHWCSHCQNEVPLLVDWLNETGGVDGIDVYAVATSTNATRVNYPPGAWLEREGWPAPVLVDDQGSSAAQAYGVSAFPFWAIVDAQGTVVGRIAGEVPPDAFETLFNFAVQG